MLNYWWVTRPKRKLDSVPEILSTIAENALDQEWSGERGSHLEFEDALEDAGLKREGDRRDHTGGGGRTYMAWIESLGLVFKQEGTGRIKLTLAGEAIMNGDSPVSVLTEQVLKYQFPSAFSVSRGVNVSERFRIRPFRYILRLLNDSRIHYITQDELAKIVITEAENESEACHEHVVARILAYREDGDSILPRNFAEMYTSSKGTVDYDKPFSHLLDIANTLFNWIEYTQLARREDKKLYILEGREKDVQTILSCTPPFIDRPHQHEFFQRKYGIDPKHHKDTRNLTGSFVVTSFMVQEQKIKKAFVVQSLRKPISGITSSLIDSIAEETGIAEKVVEEILQKNYPHGAIGSFMTEYFEMAFKGRDEATEFEIATKTIFEDTFGFKASHVGPIGLTPDVLLVSDDAGYQAIIDNKAYSKYSISNDHRNRMVHNYISGLSNYSQSSLPLAFFSYIAGGFSPSIDAQLKSITDETGVQGSAMPVSNMIKLINQHSATPFNHEQLRRIFSLNRRIELKDLVHS